MRSIHQQISLFRQRATQLLLILLCCLSVNGVAIAQKPNFPTGNPTGMAGTGNAITDSDNFFMRNNLAGLTEIPLNDEEEVTRIKTGADKGSWRFNGELQLMTFRHFRNPAFVDGTARGESITPNYALEVTYTSANHRYGFGVGSYQVINFNNRLKDTSNVQLEKRFINTDIAMGAAIRVDKHLSLGAGLLFSRLSISTVRQDETFAFREEFGGVGGMGAMVGIHYRPTNFLSIGINYKSRRTNQYSGKLKSTYFTPNRIDFVQDFDTEINIGSTIEAGIEVKPHKRLLLACDFRYYDYSVDATRSPNFIGDTLSDIQSFHSGLKYRLNNKTTISFGINFSCQGGQDDCVRTRDAIGTGISAGINRSIGKGQSLSFGFTAFPGDTQPRLPFFDIADSRERGFLFSIGFQSRR